MLMRWLKVQGSKEDKRLTSVQWKVQSLTSVHFCGEFSRFSAIRVTRFCNTTSCVQESEPARRLPLRNLTIPNHYCLYTETRGVIALFSPASSC